jgi:hypothetical protein
MLYRKLDSGGDFQFGSNTQDFYKDVPEAVAQAVKTRLLLMEGEWFLDRNQGTPYSSRILGAGNLQKYDLAIQEVILNTVGVSSLVEYASDYSTETRKITVVATISTIYGRTSFETIL